MTMLQSDLLAQAGLSHGFFTRQGGVSSGLYGSLNCGPGSKDKHEDVTENRRRAMEMMQIESDNLRTLYQVHSADVLVIEESDPFKTRPKADAMVTKIPGLALGILTADCVPILFADVENGVIAAAHSGWKGTVSDIGRNVVEAMEGLGAERANIRVAIGPAIAQASYEVGPEFPGPFLDLDPSSDRFFIPSVKPGHHMFDLKGFVHSRIDRLNVAAIDMLNNDTCAEEDLFYSYRRMTKRGEADYGRQLSAIALQK